MKKLVVGMIVLSALVAATGCSKKEEAASGGAIGVAECDEYITKYTACIAKMPAAGKSTAEAGFKTQIDAWKASASTPEGKAALKIGCKATLDSLASNALCT
ncbi:hypothetical protein BH11MYX4_BH11MYX4_42660 [soil metagenome]